MQAKPLAITIVVFAALAVLADTWLAHSTDSSILFEQSQVAPIPSPRSTQASEPLFQEAPSNPISVEDSLKSTLTIAQKLQDLSLIARVEKSLFRVKEFRSIEFEIDAVDGAIEITGSVPTDRDKLRVQRIAQNVSGVRSVDNQIQVR